MKIYHIHFRKTGGTALRSTLQRAVKPQNPLKMFSDVEFFKKVPAEQRPQALAESDFISGHFGRLGPLVPQDFLRICVLRDPLRRMISGYNHITGDYKRDHRNHAIQQLSFCEALESDKFAAELWNHQARMIIENAGEKFDRLSDKQRIDCCTTFLSEKVACFGVLEHSDRMLDDLSKKLGVRVPKELPSVNSSITESGVPKSSIYGCINSAVRRNRIDIAVYSYVLSELGY